MPDGKVGIRIVKFGFVRHLFSLLAQQVSGVQADVRIVNQNTGEKQNPPRRARKNAQKQTGGTNFNLQPFVMNSFPADLIFPYTYQQDILQEPHHQSSQAQLRTGHFL